MAEEQQRRSGVWVVVVALLLLVAYPLNAGPATWLYAAGHLPESTVPAIEAFYTPLGWAMENVPGAYRVMEWYLTLWGFSL